MVVDRPSTALAGAVTVTIAHLALIVMVAAVLPPLQPGWFPDLGATVVNAALRTCGGGVSDTP